MIKLWLTVALAVLLAVLLAGATLAVYRVPAGEARFASSDTGALLFQAKGCGGCHTVAGVAELASIGPELTHLGESAGERVAGMSAKAYVTQSIREPQAFTVQGFAADLMPTFELSDAEVESLAAFLLAKR